MISVAALINLIIILLVLAIVVSLVFWVLTQVPIPEPMNRLIRITVVVIAVLIIVVVLLNLAGVAVLHAGIATTAKVAALGLARLGVVAL